MRSPLDLTMLPDNVLRATNLFSSTKYDKPYVLPGGYAVLGHTGVDFDAPMRTHALACWPGTVKHGWDPAGFGNYLVITDHTGRQALYGHLDSYATPDGAAVGPDQLVAFTGSSGNSTGPHLHFEIVEAGPRDYSNGYRGCRDPLGGFDHVFTPRFDMNLV